jgi:hypothetical protein
LKASAPLEEKRGAAHMLVALGSGKVTRGSAQGIGIGPTFHIWNVGWVEA